MSEADIIGIIGAVAAVVAAIYAVKAFRVATTAATSAARLRQRDVQPHLTVQLQEMHWLAGVAPPAALDGTVRNVGGAVVEGFALAAFGGFLFGGAFSLPEHQPAVAFPLAQYSTFGGAYLAPTLVLLIGEDADGDWWDLLSEQRLSDPPPLPFTSPEFREWVAGLLP